MSALTDRLDEIRGEGRAALIGYLPVGYPDVETSIRAMVAMVESGVDIVEVGPPYSDPVLDGPVIQLAAAHALEGGVRLSDAFRAVRAIADAGATPVVMSYFNPMLQYGLERFAADLVEAGGAGVITPDLTPDVGEEWITAARAKDLDTIFLVAPSTTRERMHLTAAASRGFVYATPLMGVTGERAAVGDAAERVVAEAREAGAERVCVGVGVSTGAQAAEIARFADGVIVGTAFVRCLTEAATPDEGIEALRRKVSELAEGVRSPR
ncbi:tryptophan synthase subunit alpha [Demequina muriae]|uniref:Tryptophan synthase alpha chain n=1 Tax=Demequina muriae TaxID=3051664 RepID=A0ABT8GDH6_9MICO|nr:tryptophan synthase subunit alpha [Demequina sp. EGI L300058]MDN4479329.1 tryptophan synthase subunit alpha [Demequina sp. EGI L300058]